MSPPETKGHRKPSPGPRTCEGQKKVRVSRATRDALAECETSPCPPKCPRPQPPRHTKVLRGRAESQAYGKVRPPLPAPGALLPELPGWRARRTETIGCLANRLDSRVLRIVFPWNFAGADAAKTSGGDSKPPAPQFGRAKS